ncbi:hypothetical protein PG985_003661 [Apiospora marii]|uniref:Uncharacterized protein n=1 Tax=Apiospora marii TaxID=335849 RepID=A0ABR1SHF5_9PEZI
MSHESRLRVVIARCKLCHDEVLREPRPVALISTKSSSFGRSKKVVFTILAVTQCSGIGPSAPTVSVSAAPYTSFPRAIAAAAVGWRSGTKQSAYFVNSSRSSIQSSADWRKPTSAASQIQLGVHSLHQGSALSSRRPQVMQKDVFDRGHGYLLSGSEERATTPWANLLLDW